MSHPRALVLAGDYYHDARDTFVGVGAALEADGIDLVCTTDHASLSATASASAGKALGLACSCSRSLADTPAIIHVPGPESVLVADLGAESIDLLDLSFVIEETFNVTIEGNEIEREAEQAAKYNQMPKTGFGSQIRSYFLHPDQRVKDTRTGHLVGNFHSVLDGNIQGFLDAYLHWRVEEAAGRRQPAAENN